MLSFLNTLIGFVAVIALFSLFVTGVAQFLRSALRLKNRYLIERLRRLFGELEDVDRFVAAILMHSSLEGARGTSLYQTLTDPTKPAGDDAVKTAIEKVLGPPGPQDFRAGLKRRMRFWDSWPHSKTEDLNKQTIKDIATTVYARIGPLVDSSVTPGPPLLEALQAGPASVTPGAAPSVPGTSTSATPLLDATASMVAGPSGTTFRGGLWTLATAAFPEGQGKADPIKTYVAAFHDEAQASASDHFTFVMRVVSTLLAAIVVVLFNLDVLTIWNDIAAADPARVDAFAKATLAARGEAAKGDQVTKSDADAKNALALLARAPLTVCVCDKLVVGTDKSQCKTWTPWALPGNFLALLALSFGAPFWFEILKSAIDLKSAFADKGAGK